MHFGLQSEDEMLFGYVTFALVDADHKEGFDVCAASKKALEEQRYILLE